MRYTYQVTFHDGPIVAVKAESEQDARIKAIDRRYRRENRTGTVGYAVSNIRRETPPSQLWPRG